MPAPPFPFSGGNHRIRPNQLRSQPIGPEFIIPSPRHLRSSQDVEGPAKLPGGGGGGLCSDSLRSALPRGHAPESLPLIEATAQAHPHSTPLCHSDNTSGPGLSRRDKLSCSPLHSSCMISPCLASSRPRRSFRRMLVFRDSSFLCTRENNLKSCQGLQRDMPSRPPRKPKIRDVASQKLTQWALVCKGSESVNRAHLLHPSSHRAIAMHECKGG